jgi:hypothetical protein
MTAAEPGVNSKSFYAASYALAINCFAVSSRAVTGVKLV